MKKSNRVFFGGLSLAWILSVVIAVVMLETSITIPCSVKTISEGSNPVT